MRGIRKLAWFSLLFTVAASAVAAEPSAEAFMKDRQAQLFSLVKKGAEADQVSSVFDAILDYDTLAQASLRDHWGKRTEEERKEFQETLKRLVQRAYRKNLDRTATYDVTYEGETRDADTFIVRTVAKSRTKAREEPISIDYVVHRVGGQFRIRDIVTEGSSLVGNYHQQFNRIIKKDGFPELLRKMKTKLANGES